MQRKVEKNLHDFCPNCGSPKMKAWNELTADENFMVQRLPLSNEFSKEERKRHRYCIRCFYEETSVEMEKA
ncbi:MAG: hypothetical protein ABIP06_14610 [Pyrinomonadaceae bacterium]